jgi:eukaryotic-like serine/threonine-protein kinase
MFVVPSDPPPSKEPKSVLHSDPTTLQPGTLLAQRYEIVQILGQGGMGAVYKATDLELNRTVALKVIRPDLARDKAIVDRFKQELLLAHQVTHRNVIRIYDLSEAEGMKFITMEYVEGENLLKVGESEGRLVSEDEAPPSDGVRTPAMSLPGASCCWPGLKSLFIKIASAMLA